LILVICSSECLGSGWLRDGRGVSCFVRRPRVQSRIQGRKGLVYISMDSKYLPQTCVPSSEYGTLRLSRSTKGALHYPYSSRRRVRAASSSYGQKGNRWKVGHGFLCNARFKLAPQIGAEPWWPNGEHRRGPPGSRRIVEGGETWSPGCPAPILNRMVRYHLKPVSQPCGNKQGQSYSFELSKRHESKGFPSSAHNSILRRMPTAGFGDRWPHGSLGNPPNRVRRRHRQF